jgi:hypothetical protein
MIKSELSEKLEKALKDVDLVDNSAANVQMAKDVFLEYFGLFKEHDRFNKYDLIIDCRERLFGITYEQCQEALYSLSSERIIRAGMVNNQYILNKTKGK